MGRKLNAGQGARPSPGGNTELLPGSTLEDYLMKTNGGSLSPTQTTVRQSSNQRENHRKPANVALPSVELDPVLAILESDVDKLDRFRDQFRKTGTSCLFTIAVSK
ncbi:unnamed protein product [Dibothriocephalus latus]|uniref:Uncharacterized protein n=1 Tax=Dibothriocephalus latus TaxID=60516 RepID=A0A3P7LBP4_DIBLA|nr:unnamed protein product [Dibothriocephalus latus]